MFQAFVPASTTGADGVNSTRKRPRRVRSTAEEDGENTAGQSASRIYDDIIKGKATEAGGAAAERRAVVAFGPEANPNAKPAGFFCRVCEEHVTSVSEDKHNTSTLHIFNQKHRPQARKVQIDESNKGFQLLEGMGWKLDEGLGARKQGRVDPLKTTFKRDTTGLGAGGKLKPRVTHFPSHVPSQARNSSDGKSDAVRAHESVSGGRYAGRRKRQGDTGNKASTNNYNTGSGVDAGIALDDGQGQRSYASQVGENQYKNGVRVEARTTLEGDSGGANFAGGFWGKARGGASGDSDASAWSRNANYGRKGKGVVGSSGGVFLTRGERSAREEAEKRKERRRRFELFSDVPEEYASLF